MPSDTLFFARFLPFGVAAASAGFAMSISSSARGRTADHALARPLAGARVGAGALAAHRQAAPMAQAAIAAEVHQPLDVHRHLAAQIALDGEPADLGTNLLHLGVGQVLHLGGTGDAGGRADALGRGAADTVDRGQPDLDVLLVRDIDIGYTRHAVLPSRAQTRKCTVLKRKFQPCGLVPPSRPRLTPVAACASGRN